MWCLNAVPNRYTKKHKTATLSEALLHIHCFLLSCDLTVNLSGVFVFVQALEWIHDTGEFYLSTHTSTGSSIHHTQELLKEHEDFHITAKVGHTHTHTNIWLYSICVFNFLLFFSKQRSV